MIADIVTEERIVMPQWTPRRIHSLTAIQRKFYSDWKHRFFIICAGRRSRKSLISKRKLLLHAITHPNYKYFHAAPSWDQARAIFWDDLKHDTEGFWASRPVESLMSVKLINGSEISVHSLDRAFRLEGRQWNGFHITEYPNAKPGIWEKNLRPLLADTKGFAIIDGVPDMDSALAGEYEDMAKYACGGTIIDPQPGEGAYGENKDWCYYSWLSSDVLDQNEMKSLQDSYDPVLFDQEFKGSFLKRAGRVYYGFKSDLYPYGNIDPEVKYIDGLPVFVAFDFNVSPMTCCLCHIITAEDGPNKGKKEIHIFKAYHIKDYNTKSMVDRILTECQAQTLIVHSCHSGAARQTVADVGITDRRIIGESIRAAGRNVQLRHRSTNPPIRDRVNAVNALLYHNRVRINPSTPGAKELIKDFETLIVKPGSSDIDLSDPMRGHLSDALGYLIEYYFRINSQNVGYVNIGESVF
jgi:hypothetical protein